MVHRPTGLASTVSLFFVHVKVGGYWGVGKSILIDLEKRLVMTWSSWLKVILHGFLLDISGALSSNVHPIPKANENACSSQVCTPLHAV